MTGGQDSGSDGAPDTPPSPTERHWQHPSEVGLAVRGRSDRRRSSLIAVGVMISGLSLLVTGMLLGTMPDDDIDPPPNDMSDRVAASAATVTVVRDGHSSTVTGVVVDGEGHVLVRSDSLLGADEIWARCKGGELGLAEVVGVDEEENLAVLKLERPGGRPPPISAQLPSRGLEVITVGTVDGSVATQDATIDSATRSADSHSYHARLPGSSDVPDTLIFDRGGRLIAISVERTGPPGAGVAEVSTGAGEPVALIRTAAASMAVADRLITQAD